VTVFGIWHISFFTNSFFIYYAIGTYTVPFCGTGNYSVPLMSLDSYFPSPLCHFVCYHTVRNLEVSMTRGLGPHTPLIAAPCCLSHAATPRHHRTSNHLQKLERQPAWVGAPPRRPEAGEAPQWSAHTGGAGEAPRRPSRGDVGGAAAAQGAGEAPWWPTRMGEEPRWPKKRAGEAPGGRLVWGHGSAAARLHGTRRTAADTCAHNSNPDYSRRPGTDGS